MAKILLIDDDDELCIVVRNWLERDNHLIEIANSGNDGLDLLRAYPYDIIVLDWGLPDVAGIDVLAQYRKSGGNTPIIFVTGRATMDDKESGLDSGADDYLTKPFDVKELAVRIRAILRRPPIHMESIVTLGEVTVDRARHHVTKSGAAIKLFRREYALLDFLLRNPNKVFTADELLDRVWSSEAGCSKETVRTAVARLRKQLDTPGEPSIIENIRGYGYKLGKFD